jgi:hypothetical protein
VKNRISASVTKETAGKTNKLLREKTFKFKSHIIESAIDLLAKTEGAK